MNVYLRLLWRPMTAWNVFVAVAMGVFAAMTAAWMQRVGLGEESLRAVKREQLLLFVLPAAAGAALAFPAQELLYSPWSWTLPGVRARLATSLFGAALGVSVCTVVGLDAAAWLALPVLPALGLAALCFALGAAVFDPALRPRPMASLALLALVLLVFFVTPTWPVFADHPLATALGSALLAAGLLATNVSSKTARDRALTAERDLSMSFRNESLLAPILAKMGRSPRMPRLTPGAARPWPWVQAAFIEATGWSLARWARRVALLVLAIVVIVSLIAFEDGYSNSGSQREGLVYVYHAFVQPDALPASAFAPRSNVPPYYLVAYVTTLLVLLLGNVSDHGLDPERLQPLSRRDRAEIAWRSSLATSVVLTAALALALAIASEVLARILQVEQHEGALPNWLRGVALALLSAPIGQFVRRRWIDGRQRRSQLDFGVRLGLVVLALAMLAGWTSVLWGRHVEALSLMSWLALWLACAISLQLVHRALLRRWFAGKDHVAG